MARQPRIVYEGACYHVMARGNQRQEIVRDDEDRRVFVKTMGEAAEKTGWEILAWVLMNNHYHWVIRTPKANLVEGMKWFQNTYTRRFNGRHRAWGHLFGGRYKAIVVEPGKEGGSGGYLCALMDYAHLNPVRAKMVDAEKGLGLLEYPWSSLAAGYGWPAKRRPRWLAVREGLELDGLADTVSGRRKYIARLEERARLERTDSGLNAGVGETLQSTLRRGWYWGSQAFGEKLAKMVGRPANRTYRSSKLLRKRAGDEAEGILEDGLRHFGLEKAGLGGRETYAVRVAIAWALARRSSQPQRWIAEQLGLRNAANVSQLVRRFEGLKGAVKSKEIKQWMQNVKNC